MKPLAARICAVLASAALATAPMARADIVGTAVNEVVGGITTPQIILDTVTALPSCLEYSITGMCFFLVCGWTGCYISTSIKVQHNMPDDIVSTYAAPDQHPWIDYGKAISTVLKAPGDAILGQLTDSQADTYAQRPSRETIVLAKSADAIANPIAALIGGNLTSFSYPDFTELSKFPGTELPRIGQLWTQVPANLASTTLANGQAMLADATKFIGQIQKLPGQFSSLLSSVKNISSLSVPSLSDLGSLSGTVSGITNFDFNGLMGQATSAMGLATGQFSNFNVSNINAGNWASMLSSMSGLICPGSATLFGIDYNSDLDGMFWRDTVPLEDLYPATWIPGLSGGDVTQEGFLTNTWGSIYPRSNQLVQDDPVKASAVIASRVNSIITQAAQPHIYHRLSGQGSYKYFKTATNPKWQMLYPSAMGSCINFGKNDSLSASSFGDGKITSNNGYVWNLWHTWECCHKHGSYLFSVP